LSLKVELVWTIFFEFVYYLFLNIEPKLYVFDTLCVWHLRCFELCCERSFNPMLLKYYLILVKSCQNQTLYSSIYVRWRCFATIRPAIGSVKISIMLLSKGFGDVRFSHYVDNEVYLSECLKQRWTDNFILPCDRFFDSSSKCIHLFSPYKHLVDIVSRQNHINQIYTDRSPA
jgi:hypothetical protein